jgi:hypothetical protein
MKGAQMEIMNVCLESNKRRGEDERHGNVIEVTAL